MLFYIRGGKKWLRANSTDSLFFQKFVTEVYKFYKGKTRNIKLPVSSRPELPQNDILKLDRYKKLSQILGSRKEMVTMLTSSVSRMLFQWTESVQSWKFESKYINSMITHCAKST